MRSHYCGKLNESHIGQEVELVGWVNRCRDLGGVIFLDLRDREGVIQVVYDPDLKETFELANSLRAEFCVSIKGLVRPRPEGQINKDMGTGGVEVLGKELTIINRSEPLPLTLDNHQTTGTDSLSSGDHPILLVSTLVL
ncbi:MAG: hypothetical protein HRU22_18260 [Gammaproteobacteria bacterium]|nr:hypothetical protein [Gammaproteobacteria bacterium]